MPVREEEFRVTVVTAMLLEGLSARAAAERFKISKNTAAKWYAQIGPRLQQKTPDVVPPKADDSSPLAQRHHHYPTNRSVEALTGLVYDAVEASLHAIIARAQLTSDPQWVANQSGEALARLDETQWGAIVRLAGSFRPVAPHAALADRADDPESGGTTDSETPDEGGAGGAAIGRNGYATVDRGQRTLGATG